VFRRLHAKFWLGFIFLAGIGGTEAQLRGFGFDFPWVYSWAHHNYMNRLTGKIIPAVSAHYVYRPHPSSAPWLAAYGYPLQGFSATYLDLRHPELGKIYALFYFYRFSAPSPLAQLHWIFSVGEGMAWNTNPYDPVANPKNVIFGSHLLHAFRFSAGVSISAGNSPVHGEAGTVLFHFSNGAFRTPNAGLNLPGIYVRINFFSEKEKPDSRPISPPPYTPFRYGLFLRISGAEADIPRSGLQPALTVGAERRWHPSYKHIFYAGIEAMWNRAYKIYLEYLDIAYHAFDGRIPPYGRLAVTGGHMYHLGPLDFLTGIGIYLYHPARIYPPWYLRIGIRRKLHRNWSAGISLKTHYFAAEQADLGIFYIF